ncbi:MAG: hypothetical protein DMD97_21155 [Candidatus Rokuibacteriota bacterium]|nr:MAG: hypothetical protein DMD97_21155 [Candidatus Rokubacteria bacterium]
MSWHQACESSPMELLTIRLSGGDCMDTLTWSSRRFSVLGIVMLALPVLVLPTVAGGEETRAGVVTKLVGTATVARAALPQPAPLHFKDDVLLQDRITTGESSAVRVLLGGKATITARERSVLTITEIPGTATVRLASGRAAIAVVKDKMKPGEIVEIRTPNAVVAVRGTVVIAEVEPVVGGYRSTITILKGHVDVTKLDGAGRLTGAAVDVRMLERVIVTNAKPLAAAEKITRRDAESLAAQFSFVPQTGPTASTEALTAQVKAAAINDAIQAVGGVVPDPRASVNASGATSGSTSNSTSNTTTTSTTSGGTSTTTTVVGTVATPVTNTVSTVTTTLTNTVTTAVPTVTSTSLPVAAPVINPVVNTVTKTLTNVTSPAAPTVPSTGGLLSGLGR